MKLHEDINKQFFIYDNVIDDESLFDNIFLEINNNLKIGNQAVKFDVLNTETNDRFKINNKTYNKLNKLETKMFNLNYDNHSKYKLLRKDSNIDISQSISKKIIIHIEPIIKDLYNLNKLEIEHQCIIQYGPGCVMPIHTDQNTPDNERLCTVVLYCNDITNNNIGGNVLFYDNELDKNIIYTYNPKRNQMVIFDSYFNEQGIPHSVTKIENWNRSVYRIYFKLPEEMKIYKNKLKKV